MPYRVDIYIGSDNDSRRLTGSYINMVREWADNVFSGGYTLVRGNGCFKGNTEESILINAVSQYDMDLRDQLRKLKGKLGQEAILLVKTSVDFEII